MKKVIAIAALIIAGTQANAAINCSAKMNNGKKWNFSVNFDVNGVRSALNCETSNCQANINQASTVSVSTGEGNYSVQMNKMNIKVNGNEITELKLQGPTKVFSDGTKARLYFHLKPGRSSSQIKFNLRGFDGQIRRASCNGARI